MTLTVLFLFFLFGATAGQGSPSVDGVEDVEGLRRAIENNTLDEAHRKVLKLDCQNHATLTYPTLAKGQKNAVLQVYGDGCGQQRAVLVFEHRGKSWILVSDLRLSSRYDEQPMVTFPSLVDSDAQELMVEHQQVDWGTGFGQKNITIYKWLNNQLEAVLDQPESVHLSVPITTNTGRHETYALDQQSTFQVGPAGPSGAKKLIEFQKVRQGIKEVARTRNWVWEPTLSRFRSYEIAPSENRTK